MSQFIIFKQLLDKDLKGANLLIIEALRTPQQFSTFLSLKTQEDPQIEIGAAITEIIKLANINPQQYSNLFDLLFSQYEQFLTHEQNDCQLRCTLALYSFFGAFLQRNYQKHVNEAKIKFGDDHLAVFADFVVIPLLAESKFEEAWKYEKAGNLLQKMCGRGLQDRDIEMVAGLTALHERNGDDVQAVTDFLKLKFGGKFSVELKRIRAYLEENDVK